MVALLAVFLVASARTATAQGAQVVLNEIVAANDSIEDNFGATPDWIELRNAGSATSLGGWTISDDSAVWTFPDITLDAGDRLLLWASDRDLAGPQLHTNFKLAASGETVRLARPDGSLADSITYPLLADDQAYGSDESGGIGYLISPTPNAPNTGLAPSLVTVDAPSQVFTDSLDVTLSANLGGGQSIRYTTNGDEVTPNSAIYDGAITLINSTVLRAAVVDGNNVGPETANGFIAITTGIANRSSEIPIVLVSTPGAVGTTDRDAIVSVIDRSDDGRAYVLGDADYTGFAGLRIRGDSSSNFPKKQFKFELWDNPGGESRNANLLGMGSDDDWGLYAPGRYDRAMIQNPFIYELGHRIGVPAPDYQFVELWLEDEPGKAVGNGDYRGLYLLRETIEIDGNRVDIAEHTQNTAGPDGGYIMRQDRPDSCCVSIRDLNDVSGGVVAIDEPGANQITPGQVSYMDAWWEDMRSAAFSQDIQQIEQYIEVDALIDYWLLVMLSGDPDGWRLSAYFPKDVGAGIAGGPLWDYDRTLGSADPRNNELAEADGWGKDNLLISFDWVSGLWATPDIQARLRARWSQLRFADLSDSAITTLLGDLRDEILTAYDQELTIWNGGGYGPRFGNGLTGEVEYMEEFVLRRLGWIDGQLAGGQNPTVTNPGTQSLAEQQPFSLQIQASGGAAFDFEASDLPAGLSMTESGLISGTVGFGDAITAPITVTVTNNTGGSATITFTMAVTPSFAGPASVILNEYNAVSPGALLDLGGTDATFGRVAGNGGDWFEVVTIEDHLDLRGWRFDLLSNGLLGVQQTASLTLGQDERLADIRAGTILTVAESIPDDLSYDPAGGDWTIQLQANSAQQGALWASQSDFDTNNKKWRLVIRDDTATIRGPIAGETEPWDDANLGVSGGEVMHLAADPNPNPNLLSDYTDSVESSFGQPNPTSAGQQNFEAIRPTVVIGDVDCDNNLSSIDALSIIQYRAGLRTPATCPLPNANTSLDTSNGDLNGDGVTDLLDALVVSQCVVGILDSGFCPED